MIRSVRTLISCLCDSVAHSSQCPLCLCGFVDLFRSVSVRFRHKWKCRHHVGEFCRRELVQLRGEYLEPEPHVALVATGQNARDRCDLSLDRRQIPRRRYWQTLDRRSRHMCCYTHPDQVVDDEAVEETAQEVLQ